MLRVALLRKCKMSQVVSDEDTLIEGEEGLEAIKVCHKYFALILCLVTLTTALGIPRRAGCKWT